LFAPVFLLPLTSQLLAYIEKKLVVESEELNCLDIYIM